jgi:hypothetical protein
VLDSSCQAAYDEAMRNVWLVIVSLAALLTAACAGGRALHTEQTSGNTLQPGSYDVVLYETQGPEGEHSSFVILDMEGDQYQFVPPTLVRQISRQEHVPAGEAMEHAALMMGTEPTQPYRVRRITIGGVPIGYELLPQDSYPTSKVVGNLLRIDYHVDPKGKVHFKSTFLPFARPEER